VEFTDSSPANSSMSRKYFEAVPATREKPQSVATALPRVTGKPATNCVLISSPTVKELCAQNNLKATALNPKHENKQPVIGSVKVANSAAEIAQSILTVHRRLPGIPQAVSNNQHAVLLETTQGDHPRTWLWSLHIYTLKLVPV